MGKTTEVPYFSEACRAISGSMEAKQQGEFSGQLEIDFLVSCLIELAETGL